MADKDDDLLIEGAKRLKQLIQDKNIKASDVVNILETSKGTMTKWLQNSTPSSAQSLIELARLVGMTERWNSESKQQTQQDQADLVNKAYVASEVDLSQATMEQLMGEIKDRYAALNLKADIKITVEPLEGGFVSKE
ncbi:XRE family transcriptional regulator [Acinetobacter sp. WCHAc060033]|uniref:XRE family transcriptional regulator n=1 Tax=Acinetobacter wuhouensis TaxID=1879050 RepID=A0A3G2T7F1_9GAMM|nr:MULTISPECIES: helix-turn-helix transcriptional regulator [Acinetobacter]AYO56228.1 XRE family transcriptional regulator [Acinetobacter wuhouensis]RZG73244.1 XRE family transcriptional regulator [Acinetobacter wuhouensis]RZG88695.1 XRE family transcriptional regulator [Acinetobacter sp. WCHAc060033]